MKRQFYDSAALRRMQSVHFPLSEKVYIGNRGTVELFGRLCIVRAPSTRSSGGYNGIERMATTQKLNGVYGAA